MRTTMITGALAVVATTVLTGGTATAQEPTTTHERGIVIECSGTYRGHEVYTSVYENNTVKNVVQVVIGDDDGLGAIRETAAAFRTGRDVRATLPLDGKRAVIAGTARAVGAKTAVHEEHDDAGQYITIDGTHRKLATDLTLTWKKRTVPLTCDDAFVYDLQVTKESAVD